MCLVCRRSPWLEITLYATGMLCLITSVGAFVSSIGPSPFSEIVWYSLIGSGAVLLLLGVGLVIMAVRVRDYGHFSWPHNGAFTSVASQGVTVSVQDLIGSEDIVVYENDSAIVNLQDAERLTKVIKSCMMIQTSSSDCINYNVDLFKETYV